MTLKKLWSINAVNVLLATGWLTDQPTARSETSVTEGINECSQALYVYCIIYISKTVLCFATKLQIRGEPEGREQVM